MSTSINDIKTQMAAAEGWNMSDAIESSMTDEVMERVKKKFSDAMDDLESDLNYGLKQRLSSNLSNFICSSAESAIKQLLAGNEERMRSYLSAKDGFYTGRDHDHHVIHGELFETGPLELRKQIVDAHADLLKNERILDLESQLRALVEQVNKLENQRAGGRRIEQLEDALSWVLPMAKGYAAAHPVGGNARKIAAAETILHPPINEDAK